MSTSTPHKQPARCGACRHWQCKPDDRMVPHGFGHCAKQPAGYHSTKSATCRFSPSLFSPKEPA